jgi:pyrimidine-nucleoside phosphorylase
MIEIGAQMGCQVVALLTDMDQPLGRAVGNALEVAEAIDVLTEKGPADLTEVTYALTAEMLKLAGIASDDATARGMIRRAIDSGSALAKLEEIVSSQYGDPGAIREPARLPTARMKVEIPSPGDGFVASIDAEAIGLAAMALGAGRDRVDGRVDPAVGLVILRKVGEGVKSGQPLVRVHYNEEKGVEDVVARILHAYRIESSPVAPRPLIYEHLPARPGHPARSKAVKRQKR